MLTGHFGGPLLFSALRTPPSARPRHCLYSTRAFYTAPTLSFYRTPAVARFNTPLHVGVTAYAVRSAALLAVRAVMPGNAFSAKKPNNNSQ